MNKNLIITVLTIMLVLAIKDLESTYPDYVDTVSGGDAYNEWYNY